MKQPFKHPYLLVFVTPLAQFVLFVFMYVPFLYPIFMVPLGINHYHYKLQNYLFYFSALSIFDLGYFAFLGICCVVYSKFSRLMAFLLIWTISSGICSYLLPFTVDAYAFAANLLYSFGFYWWYRKFELQSVHQK